MHEHIERKWSIIYNSNILISPPLKATFRKQHQKQIHSCTLLTPLVKFVFYVELKFSSAKIEIHVHLMDLEMIIIVYLLFMSLTWLPTHSHIFILLQRVTLHVLEKEILMRGFRKVISASHLTISCRMSHGMFAYSSPGSTFTVSFVVGRKIQMISLSCMPSVNEWVDAVGNHFVDDRLVS